MMLVQFLNLNKKIISLKKYYKLGVLLCYIWHIFSTVSVHKNNDEKVHMRLWSSGQILHDFFGSSERILYDFLIRCVC